MQSAMLRLVLITALAFLLVAVQISARGLCDPLEPEYCYLPFPNQFYLAPSADSATGFRVNYSTDSFPSSLIGVRVDPTEWNTMDGFSTFPSILTYFANLSDSNLPPHWDMKQSISPTSPTILLDAVTGERLPHFAELDQAIDLPQRALMIWPSRRLKDSHRYIVALHSLKTTTGSLIQPSYAFKALRDNITTKNPDIEFRRTDFKEIFNRLESIGVKRELLQLAWDFSTASMTCLTNRLVYARDDALARVGPGGPQYRIVETNDNYSSNIYRRIKGEMEVPLYLNSSLPGQNLVINQKTGLPVCKGTATAEFTVLVPRSVASGQFFPARIVQYGHGLFGSQSEVETSYLQEQANEYGYVMVASDWWGMAEYDVPSIVYMMSFDPSKFGIIPDRSTQGMVNALLLMRLMKGDFSREPKMEFGNRSVIENSPANYYGNSLGGIMGEVYMAATTDVTQGAIGVGGGPFGLLLPRSKDFEELSVLLRLLYPDPVHYISFLAFANMIWSRLEPNAYMSSITSNPLPNTPTHRVIYYYALGDAQVNILGLYSITRSSDVLLFENHVLQNFSLPNGGAVVTEELFGLPVVPSDTVVTQESAAVGFDCGAPPEPSTNVPPNGKYDTHEGPRRTAVAMKQMHTFFETGEIRNLCEGPCTCTV